jgi:hypothetical protein
VRGDIAVAGNAEVGGAAGRRLELGDLIVRCGEADLEAVDLAEPALAFGFSDAGDQVVADVDESRLLRRVRSQERASDAGVLVDAAGSIGPTAGAQGDLAVLEVAEELLPLLVGGRAIFGGGPQVTAAGEVGAVAVDGFFGVDG